MEEDSTILQLTYLLSGIMRRINDIPLDKDADMRFKYMPPEKRAENHDAGLHPTATRTENEPCRTKTSPSISSPASQPQS